MQEIWNHLMFQCRFGWGCLVLCLRVEGRRDWEVGLRYGVKMNHIFTLESIEFSFFKHTYIIPL